MSCQNWDNTPRSAENGLVIADSTPSLFRSHLRDAIRLARVAKTEPPIVFVKSWNEWAEGNHLEPDLRFGHGYLEAIPKALKETNAGERVQCSVTKDTSTQAASVAISAAALTGRPGL